MRFDEDVQGEVRCDDVFENHFDRDAVITQKPYTPIDDDGDFSLLLDL